MCDRRRHRTARRLCLEPRPRQSSERADESPPPWLAQSSRPMTTPGSIPVLAFKEITSVVQGALNLGDRVPMPKFIFHVVVDNRGDNIGTWGKGMMET